MVACLGEVGAVADAKDTTGILSPGVVVLMLEWSGGSSTSGLGICLGERCAVVTEGIADRLLSPGDTRIGLLGGDACGLPLYMA